MSPSLGDAGRRGSHFVSGGGQKVAVVSRHTRACPLVPPTLSSAAVAAPIAAAAAAATAATTTASRSLVSSRSTDAAASSAARPPLRRPRCSPLTARPGPHYLGPPSLSRPSNHLAAPRRLVRALRNLRSSAPPPLSSSAATSPPAAPPAAAPLAPSRSSRVRVRDIITPFYSRFIGLYQLYEPANERRRGRRRRSPIPRFRPNRGGTRIRRVAVPS